MTERPGVYVIRNTVNGKVYVGSASNISKRWHRHRKDLRLGRHKNLHLQAAWAKYGEGAFVFEVLEHTADLDCREQYWIDATLCTRPSNGYNMAPVARSTRGVKLGTRPESVRSAISAGVKGRAGFGITSEPLRGEANRAAKLTRLEVEEM